VPPIYGPELHYLVSRMHFLMPFHGGRTQTGEAFSLTRIRDFSNLWKHC